MSTPALGSCFTTNVFNVEPILAKAAKKPDPQEAAPAPTTPKGQEPVSDKR